MTTTVAGPGAPRSASRSRSPLRQLARRVHFMAGLAIAPFLVVLALTGLAYAFTPQINDLLYGEELSVEPRSESPRPLAEQVESARATHPDAEVSSVITPAEPDRTTQVVLDGIPGLDDSGGPFASESLTVYVDPYTAGVTGELVTVNNRPPAQEWLRTLHSSLHLGDVGTLYSEFVASWLPFVVLGGLVLWIGQRRRTHSARALLVPARTPRGRVRLRSWHGVLGLWLAIGLLAISVTGLTWSTYAGDRVDTAITALDGKSPELSTPEATAPTGGRPIDIDSALDLARHEGLRGQLTLIPPAETTEPYRVEESAEGLPIRKTEVAIDPYDQEVTAQQGWQDYPLPAKLTTLGIAAHSGTLFGLANQLVMASLAIGALTLLVLGYRMWWQRRPARGGLAVPPPPVWPRVSTPTLLTLLLTAGVLGWLIPVFGVTLAGFVLLDGLLTTITRRRRRTTLSHDAREDPPAHLDAATETASPAQPSTRR